MICIIRENANVLISFFCCFGDGVVVTVKSQVSFTFVCPYNLKSEHDHFRVLIMSSKLKKKKKKKEMLIYFIFIFVCCVWFIETPICL